MRVFRLAAIAVVLAACGSSSATLNNAAPAAPAGRSYELGRGVKRDYKRAIELYARECSNGRGDIAACDGWYRLNERLKIDTRDEDRTMVQALCERGGRYYCFMAVVRGVPATRAIEKRLEEQAKRCQANDRAACDALAAAMSPKTEVDRLLELGIDVAATPDQCKAGDAAACKIALTIYGLVHITSSRRSEKEDEVTAAACGVGVLDVCGEILDEALKSCRRLNAPRAKCLDAVAADDGEASVTTARLALRKLTAACEEGDADACRHVPGRIVKLCDLCEAGDAAACGGTVRANGSCQEIERSPLRALTGFKERMCACSDVACGNSVTNDMAEWSTAVVDLSDDGPADPAAVAMMTDLVACQQKLAP